MCSQKSNTLGFIINYNILSHLNDIKCPKCQKTVYPKNFGFFQCKDEIEYDKWENNKKKVVQLKEKLKKNLYYFLNIQVLQLFLN